MRNLLFLIASLAISLSCHTPDPKPTGQLQTVVGGKILDISKYPNIKTISFNPLSGESYPQFPVNSEGEFELSLDIDGPKEMQLDPMRSISFMLAPGDSIYIEVSIDHLRNTKFSGRMTYNNQDLLRYYQDGFFADNANTRDPKDPQDYLAIRESSLRANLDGLHRFLTKYDMKPVVARALLGRIYNHHYAKLYEFGTRYCDNIFDGYDPEQAITERYDYFQFVNEVRSNLGNWKNGYGHEQLLYRHNYYFMTQEYPELEPAPGEAFAFNDFNRQIDTIIKREPNFDFKSHMLFTTTDGALSYEKSWPWFDQVRKKIKPHLSSEHWVKLEEKYDLISDPDDVKFSEYYLIDHGLTNPMIKALFDQTDANVIYLDLWTTWCGGCYSDILRSQDPIADANKKQIDFFFLCSGDKSRYDKFVNENNLAGHHIFLQRDESKQLNQDFRLNYVPFKVLLRRDEAIVRMAPGAESDLNSIVLQKFIERFAAGYEESL